MGRIINRLKQYVEVSSLFLRILRRAFVEFFRETPWLVTGILIIELINSLLPFAVAFFTGVGINRLSQAALNHNVSLTNVLVPFIVAFIGTALGYILRPIGEAMTLVAADIMSERTTRLLNLQLVTLDLAQLESADFKNRVTKTGFRAQFVHRDILRLATGLVTGTAQLVTATLLLIHLNVWLLGLMVLVAIPAAIVNLVYGRKLDKIWDDHGLEMTVQRRLTSFHLESETGVEIRLNHSYDYLIEIINKFQKTFRQRQNRVRRSENIWTSLATIAEEAVRLGVEIWLVLRVFAGTIGIGTFTFYTSVVGQFRMATMSLFNSVYRGHDSAMVLRDLYTIFDAKPTILTVKKAHRLPSTLVPSIEFRDVSFAYPGAESEVFSKINFIIKPGERVALVGPNGAGKSTLIKLLARLYEPTHGQILIDGVDLGKVDLDDWRSTLGVLLQDYNKYTLSARENIEIGRIEKSGDLDRIGHAVTQADAGSIVAGWKDGLDQKLFKIYPAGIMLSGGQWQRLALARTFYRQANVVVLDEPTAAVDAKAEGEIFDRLMTEHQGKSSIIISHRFSTVRRADRIFVLDKGKIVEEGSHEELMQIDKGVYRELFEIQAKGYR